MEKSHFDQNGPPCKLTVFLFITSGNTSIIDFFNLRRTVQYLQNRESLNKHMPTPYTQVKVSGKVFCVRLIL